MMPTIALVVVVAVSVGWPMTPTPRHPRSAAPGPQFWGVSSAERGGGAHRVSAPTVAAVGFVLVGLAAGSPAAATVGPFVAVTMARERSRRCRLRAEAAHADSLLDFVDAVVGGLRAGGSLSGSIVTAATTDRPSSGDGHPGLRRLVAGLAAGRRLPDAFIDAFSEEVGSFGGDGGGCLDEDLLVATVIALDASGGSAADALDRVGDAFRERRSARADARTQAQQAISSAAVMAALPLLFGVAAAAAEPGVGHLYRSTWIGAACAWSAVVLTIAGWEWQRRLIEGPR